MRKLHGGKLARPPALPADQKVALILSVLSGELSAAQAARNAGVSDQAISTWKRRFVEAGRTGLERGTDQRSSRESQLLDEIAELKRALGDSYMQLRTIRSAMLTRSAGPGPAHPLGGVRVLRQCRSDKTFVEISVVS